MDSRTLDVGRYGHGTGLLIGGFIQFAFGVSVWAWWLDVLYLHLRTPGYAAEFMCLLLLSAVFIAGGVRAMSRAWRGF